MAVIMNINTSMLYSHGRMDPEYYTPDHLLVEDILSKNSTVPLGALGHITCSAFYPAATHLYESGNIPFLRCVDIVDYPVISADQDFALIPDEFIKSHSSIRCLSAGDVIISKVGSPCFTSLLGENMSMSAMTRTVLGLSDIKGTLVDRRYLVVFLRSKYGFSQLMRERELTIQYQLTLDRTRKIQIALPCMEVQNQIGDLFSQYQYLRSSAQSLYTQAEQLLEHELGLDKIEFENPISHEASFSEVLSNNRADADYYQTKFRELKEHINKIRTLQLSDLFSLLKGVEVGSKAYRDNGKLFIRVSNLTPQGVVTTASDKYIEEPLYNSLKLFKSNQGDILLTKDGTVGICYVVDEEIEGIICGGILKLQMLNSNISPEYLALAINSKFCQMQAQRDCCGALIVHWKPGDIKKLRIPILQDSIMQNLADMVTRAKSAKRQSQLLLAQAKQRVEDLIEEGIN